ncbi:hypothetical protein HMPREF9123_2819 [Neisseria bacilliformis ATCC BAA-1200]|uniref:Uncharacterized protein n=1 Tax=Neisseria bacilliformis ATCC BAA-1200 TaxID=888742 RepID=F2BGG2_9NEIS|nr:hypothetical protein HMPREF9123_2819 [Neisseria bacilliformis ATCC BAA-1200]
MRPLPCNKKRPSESAAFRRPHARQPDKKIPQNTKFCGRLIKKGIYDEM